MAQPVWRGYLKRSDDGEDTGFWVQTLPAHPVPADVAAEPDAAARPGGGSHDEEVPKRRRGHGTGRPDEGSAR